MARIAHLLLSLLLTCLATTSANAKAVSAIRSNNPKLASAKRIRNQNAATLPGPQKYAEAAWLSGVKNSLASSLAAASSKIILAPFDTIKTLQQHSRSVSTDPLSLIESARIIIQRPRGVLELYSGICVAVVGSMPSVALYFGIYSFCKKRFAKFDPNEKRRVAYIALSAAIGNTIASASRVPYEVMKQKLQTQVYANIGEAIRDMSFRTLFPMGGIASQMLRDIPYAVVTLMTYEHLKSVWKPRAQSEYPQVPARSWDLLVGGIAGGVGSYLTNPFDVIKTRLQTSSELYGGSVRTCFSITLQEGGAAAFLRGSVPRLIHKVPANAFFFLFYEFFRSVLGVDDDVTMETSKK
ncbi:MAG: hypothetical protein SGBAC_001275 [Bacillariaceae sp.]